MHITAKWKSQYLEFFTEANHLLWLHGFYRNTMHILWLIIDILFVALKEADALKVHTAHMDNLITKCLLTQNFTCHSGPQGQRLKWASNCGIILEKVPLHSLFYHYISYNNHSK